MKQRRGFFSFRYFYSAASCVVLYAMQIVVCALPLPLLIIPALEFRRIHGSIPAFHRCFCRFPVGEIASLRKWLRFPDCAVAGTVSSLCSAKEIFQTFP